jgi:hypothetical protein
MNTETPSYSWSIEGSAICTTSGTGQKYYHISPSCAAGNVLKAKVSVNAGGITKFAEAEILVTAARQSSSNPPAELTSDIFNQMLPPVLNPGMGENVSLRNFSPGQFTNGGSGFGWSLGAFGGYEVWKLRRINNNTRNVQISGNPMATWSEPGIVWVSIDDNQNGVPDDTWYELKGSDDDNSSFRNQISRNYAVRYIKPPDYGESENQYGQKISNIYWVDSKGRTGRMHGAWPSPWGVSLDENWVIYSGTNIRDYGAVDGGAGSLMDFVYGYVDAATTGAEWDKFDISWAVKADGTPANLPWIDFVKVQTGTFHYGGAFGEFSTEINYADGLGNQTNFPKPEDS